MDESTVQQEDDSILAHRADDGRLQPLAEHLRNTARLAGEFAAAFQARLWACAAALLHDDGKVSHAFQRRIRGDAIHVDHSTPGAKFAFERLLNPKGSGRLIAYCVAGHHAGLPDGNSGEDESCLAKRLARSESGAGYLATELPISLESEPLKRLPTDPGRRGFSAAFFTRMLYSALVDADFLDTEAFLESGKASKRGGAPSLRELKLKLDRHMAQLSARAEATELNRLRASILAECRASAHWTPGLFSLTVPTGGGKTLSSMAFAMDHALIYGLRRIIYVIPYTSIIEQTVREFRFVFGPEAVLEHHSNFVREQDGQDDEAEERRLLAAENWDAPIVVTTNVQFFESFFANRSSRTRKLHNVARSVVILDEAQMLPVPVLRPTIEVIRELARGYGTSLVLCTATQPALTVNDDFRNGLEGVREMMSAPLHGVQGFARVRETQLGVTDDLDIARLIRNTERCLCIVNTKKHARQLFESIVNTEGAFHLSAAMCPVHRSRTLGDPRDPAPGTIRWRLRHGGPCRVVSTQLVEAGVDIDFPVVIRAIAGIDSIVQAAGRCNREGRISGGGRLYVFMPQEELPVPQLRQNAQIAALVIQDGQDWLLGPNTVRAYFKELYWLKDATGGLDSKGIMSNFLASAASGDFPFKTVAGLYHVIPEDQISIVVPFNEMASELCAQLRCNTRPGAILRKLQPYTIQVYPRVLADLCVGGYAESLQDGRYHVLTDIGRREIYDERLGLSPETKEFFEVENLMI
jgi:CRISPR-associated endonuclease/helicase Cas3